jgi:hypothetical protein
MSSLKTYLVILATAAIAAGQAEKAMAAGLSNTLNLPRQNSLAPRSLSPGSTVCVNSPLNLTGMEIDASTVIRELAGKISEAGFHSGPASAFESCDATVFTEIVSVTGRARKKVETEFRIVIAGEQIPRLCSSAHGKSMNRRAVLSASWQEALIAAISDEVRQIRDAQQKGMVIYQGAVE